MAEREAEARRVVGWFVWCEVVENRGEWVRVSMGGIGSLRT